MKISSKLFVGTFVALTLFGTGTAYANISPNAANATVTRPLHERSSVSAPLGFQIFCLQNASQCRSSGSKTVAYSANLMRALNSVNRRVNRSIRPQNDLGVDTWSINVRRGDCEDYVLAKRAALISMGVSAGALRIATARTRRGIPHAVLVVRTNQGDYILDNLSGTIKQWNTISHQLIAMSGANPLRWKNIS